MSYEDRELEGIRKDIKTYQDKMKEIEEEWEEAKRSYEESTPAGIGMRSRSLAKQKEAAKKRFLHAGGDPDDFEDEWPAIQDSRRRREVLKLLVDELSPTASRRVGF
jgi:hypothetical protein